MEVSKQFLKSIKIHQLKRVKSFECSFEDKRVTALLGINGCGKSTILHALACCFRPQNSGEDHLFSDFFLPNTYNAWSGSSFEIQYDYKDTTQNIDKLDNIKQYKKTADRWIRYNTRPIRDVFYIGIDSCVPDVEKEKSRTKIKMLKGNNNQVLNNIKDKISYILGGDYQECYDAKNKKKTYRVVKNNNIEYPSLAMGAGEQRLLTILDKVFSAPQFSLILIDELDLTLHSQALNRLLDVLVKYSNKKELQIIFTTHRETITTRIDINIRHIYQSSAKTFCFSNAPSTCMDILTGKPLHRVSIFVEDLLSKAIVSHIARNLKIQKYCDIKTFGDICNGFTVATVVTIEGKQNNSVVVLDGDKYTKEEEKVEMIEKRFSGNTKYEIDIRDKALSIIFQYNSPNKKSPDQFIIENIKTLTIMDEICDIIKQEGALLNYHEYADCVANKLDMHKMEVYNRFIDIMNVHKNLEWQNFIEPIRKILETKKIEFNMLDLPA